MTTQWVCGSNMPGYLPDCEPMVCDSWEAARDALTFELARYDSEDDTENAQADAALALFDDAPAGHECSAQVGLYRYWIEAAL